MQSLPSGAWLKLSRWRLELQQADQQTAQLCAPLLPQSNVDIFWTLTLRTHGKWQGTGCSRIGCPRSLLEETGVCLGIDGETWPCCGLASCAFFCL